MQTQTFTQTITILVGDVTGGAIVGDVTDGTLADTGMSLALVLGIALGLILISAIIFLIFLRQRHSFRGLAVFTFLALGITSLAFAIPTATATPVLTGQQDVEIVIPQGGGTATITTSLTVSTANNPGYTLTASLEDAEPGIDISLKGGNITTSTDLVANATPLTISSTDSANDPGTPDDLDLELTFTIAGTVAEGKKELQLSYIATDNEQPVPPAPITMQAMTKDYCTNQMSIYDGTNEEAVLHLLDPRGNTEAEHQTYQVAKLADNNCWMLNNLKLGSTTGTITLTPADSNVGSNFTLPQVQAGGSYSHDNPTVSGPIPGDTGSGATNYGYLYNWSAATAGETRTSITTGNAAHSICAKGWRLPTGGTGGDFAQLDQAFGGPGTGSWSGEANIAQWQHNGPFKGVFSGFWYGGFDDQGSWGNLWSSSAYPDWSDSAFNAGFYADGVSPGNLDSRSSGNGVRCLLN